jgi:hypothetical protein
VASQCAPTHPRRLGAVLLASCVFLIVATAAAWAAAPLPLKARLATTSDFPAYERSRVVVIKSPVEWSHGDAFISPQTLRHLGFVAAAVANMQTISVQRRAETSLDSAIVQFRSTAGATAYQLGFVGLQTSRYKHFAVTGVPHAYGFANPQQGAAPTRSYSLTGPSSTT